MCVLSLADTVCAREWTDRTGHFSITAELMAYNDTLVVLLEDGKELVALRIEDLSSEDQEYLQSKEAEDAVRNTVDTQQIWTMRNGMKVVGQIVGYSRDNVTIQRRRGDIYVNGRVLENLSDVYRKMIPHIVAHFENIEIVDEQGLRDWVIGLKGAPRTFTCDGVVMELENGDEYSVPFFFFSQEDFKMLEPGWLAWQAADQESSQRAEESLMLQARAEQYRRDQIADRQIALLQLQLQGYDAGLFSLWKVELIPGPQTPTWPLWVIVPGQNSAQARQTAMAQYPGYVARAVARVRREF
ncbi:MAG: SHD1 domain-containing protein [Pirellulaceae bacterium]